MKFQCRIIAALILCIFVVILYHIYSKSHHFMSNRLISDILHQKSLNKKVNNVTKLIASESVHFFTEGKRSKMELLEAITDIKTIDILCDIHENKDFLQLESNEINKAGSLERKHKIPFFRSKLLNPVLQVIVVPHSHNDPGWHKTVDGYYEDQTKNILNNMVDKLQKYPKMTFVWAETVFLAMWWKDLKPERRQAVKRLVLRQQLEIVVGSWVVPDEANTHYFALIDQMIEGHQWLEENLGVHPQNSWSLDPFGYSSLLPYLYKKAGFNNIIILRVHSDVKKRLASKHALEFYWRQTWDESNVTDIFTLLMPYMLYSIKHSCGPDPHICVKFDFRKIAGEISDSRAQSVHSGNVEEQAKMLLGQYRKKAALFRHNVVLIPLGDDFRFDREIEWDQQYSNYQRLFDHMNNKEEWNVHARFGTPQDYFDAVKTDLQSSTDSNISDMFPTLSGDFFPYSDHNDEYWTGYFTTRPFLKSLGRDVEVYLKSADILNTLATMHWSSKSTDFILKYETNSSFSRLATARQHLSLFQHHDAITGTARSWVAIDYENRLQQALQITQSVIKDSMIFLLSIYSVEHRISEIKVRVLDPPNSQSLTPTEFVVHIPKDGCKIVLFNNLAQSRHELIRFAIDRPGIAVLDRSGTRIPIQIGPVWNALKKETMDIFEIAFMAVLLPMSFTSFNIIIVDEAHGINVNVTDYGVELPLHEKEQIIIENKFIQARISIQSGQLVALNYKRKNVKDNPSNQYRLNLQLLTYTSKRSGAYIFAPTGPATNKHFQVPITVRVIIGPVFSEVLVHYNSATQIFRVVNCRSTLATVLEINNIIDVTHLDDQEVIMRLNSSIQNRKVFYTDQNGYHILERKQFSNSVYEANYYPSTSMVYIEDMKSRLTIVNAQPVGVSSLGEGSIEIMLDRRLKYDDGRGLGEGILDNRRVLSRFYIFVEQRHSHRATESKANNRLNVPSITALILADRLRDYPIITVSNYPQSTLPIYSALSVPLPCDTMLVNLRVLGSSLLKHSAALIIHRRSYVSLNQDLNVEVLQCPILNNEGSDFIPDNIFKDVKLRKVILTSLSLMNNIQKLEPGQSIPLLANELYTFKLLYP